MADHVRIGDLKVDVVSEDQAEKADMLLCMRKGGVTPFTDNLEGECSHCGYTVVFRPYMPKNPPKICMECACAMLSATKQ